MATALGGIVLKESKLAEIISRAKEYAQMNGVLMRLPTSPGSSECLTYAPFTLFPSLVPRQHLNQIKTIQTHFATLMHKVAHDHEFLQNCLKNVVQVDDFNGRLWDIYETVRKEGVSQPLCLGLFRNDYMMDFKESKGMQETLNVSTNIKMKQIEFNMMASSFGGLVTALQKVHKYSLSLAGVKVDNSQLPENRPSYALAEGLVKAWEMYSNESSSILFLVSDPEQNRIDQRWIDSYIYEINPRITVIYRTLLDVATRAELSSDKKLLLDGEEIAVVYMRAGYSPDDYTSDREWNARLLMERSKAIKCPTVSYQLAGCKKVQQELCRGGAVEKYLTDKEICGRIRSTFANQYSLDLNEDGDKAIAIAMEDCEKFVLKPNREGGGNNIYGEDIKHMLSSIIDSNERSSYILMERIFPWVQQNVLLKSGIEPALHNVVSEIGIYSCYIGTSTEEHYNELAGHLVRTKSLGTDEGGIVKGFSCLDTPVFMDT